jgi:glycosyltransferase 2 family protein
MNRARVANLLGIAIGIAGLAFVALRIVRDRQEIADALSSSDPVWLVVAVAFGMAAMTLLGVNWLLIVRRGGAPAPWRRGLYWFFVGQLGKYVPGGIWPIVGQAELAHRDRTPRPVAYWSTAMSMVATLLGAALTAAIAGLVSPAGSRLIPALLTLGLIAVAVIFASQRARDVLHRLADRVTSRELRLPPAGWFALLVARYLPMWVLFAGMNVFSVKALGGTLDADLVMTLIYATCVSWIAGFVIIGLPGGLGVREAVFISMMTGPLGAGLAVSVAVISRLVSVAVDLLGAAISVPVGRSAPPIAEHQPRDEADGVTRYASR